MLPHDNKTEGALVLSARLLSCPALSPASLPLTIGENYCHWQYLLDFLCNYSL